MSALSTFDHVVMPISDNISVLQARCLHPEFAVKTSKDVTARNLDIRTCCSTTDVDGRGQFLIQIVGQFDLANGRK